MGTHRRRDGEVSAPPRDLAAEFALLADQAGALLPRLEAGDADTRTINELIILGLRFAEASAALDAADPGQAVMEAAYAQGWADRDAVCAQEHGPGAGQRSSRSRRGGGHLRVLPALPATVVRAAATAAVVAGLAAGGVAVAGLQEEAAVATVAAPPARHAGLQRMAPDRAVVVPPSRRAPSPRPSAAVASASPVPVVAPVPAVPSSPLPASPPPVAAVVPPPPLDVPRLLDLGDSTRGLLPLAATGAEEVPWTATGTDGIVLSPAAGVAVPGQPVTLDVTDPTGGGGWAYVSFGGTTAAVEITSSLGDSGVVAAIAKHAPSSYSDSTVITQ